MFWIATALAGSIEATPFGFVRALGSWIEDSDSSSADQDGFFLVARLGAQARYDIPSLIGPIGVDATIETDLSPEFSLKDAWIRATPHPGFSLTAGQQKIPFSLHQLTSETRRQLPNSPRINAAIGISRDIGAVAELRLPVAEKVRAIGSVGLFNGEGSNRIQNVNEEFLLALRGLITPFGARPRYFEGIGQELYLGFGGGWVYNLTGEGEGAQERNVFGAELQFAYKWVSLQGEYMDAEVFNASVDVADFHIRGGYGQLGLFVPVAGIFEQLELVSRWEWSDPNTAFTDIGLSGSGASAIPAFQAAMVITGGINYYFVPPAEQKPAMFHDVKLSVAYSHAKETEGDSVLDDTVIGVASVRF